MERSVQNEHLMNRIIRAKLVPNQSQGRTSRGMSSKYMDCSVTYQQLGDDDPDSRDSGVCMEVDENQETDFSSLKLRHWGKKSSTFNTLKQLPDLEEEMEEVVLNETLHDLDDTEARTELQLRQHGRKVADTPRKGITDVTNKYSDNNEESPKSHLLHISRTPVEQRRIFSRQSSYCETNVSRKRFCSHEVITVKRRRNVRFFGNQKFDDECEMDEATTSASLKRVQSMSSIESSSDGECYLPGMLHVEYSLRTVTRPQIDSVAFKSIEAKTLADLITSMSHDEFLSRFILVDCRYPYEYNGGHIKGAINVFDPTLVERVFFPDSPTKFSSMLCRIPIFYCEYSQKRGPAMAAALRHFDRVKNESRYPEVDYKEIYVLDRGYKKFYAQDSFTDLCEPSSYVPMNEPLYTDQLKRFSMHKTKSFGGLSSCFRANAAENCPRRTKLNFRSLSDDVSPPHRRALLDPSTTLSPVPKTPPQAVISPIRMATFS